MCILMLLSEMFYSLLDIIGLHMFTYMFKSSISSLSFYLMFFQFWKWSIDVSNYHCWIIYFSLKFCQFLLHKFWSFAVGCIKVYDCHTVFVDWHSIIIKTAFLVSSKNLSLKSILSDISSSRLTCVSPKFLCWSPTSSIYWGWGLWEIITFAWGHKGVVLMMGLVPLWEETKGHSLHTCPCI